MITPHTPDQLRSSSAGMLHPGLVTWRYSVRGVASGLLATPGCWAVRRPNLTMTLLPWRPRRYLAAWSPSQPSVERPSMLSSCTCRCLRPCVCSNGLPNDNDMGCCVPVLSWEGSLPQVVASLSCGRHAQATPPCEAHDGDRGLEGTETQPLSQL